MMIHIKIIISLRVHNKITKITISTAQIKTQVRYIYIMESNLELTIKGQVSCFLLNIININNISNSNNSNNNKIKEIQMQNFLTKYQINSIPNLFNNFNNNISLNFLNL